MGDEYTAVTRAWLDARYGRPAQGPYVPHQPIHGFEHARETGVLWDYVRIYRILVALSHLRFRTVLDVGAGEGLTSVLAARLFHATAEVTDLSAEACGRARELFGLEATPADVHSLPFGDESFDVVMCAETLEHVTDVGRAAGELLRVARTAVMISVPNEPRETVEANRKHGNPHSHIHSFDAHSFDHLRAEGIRVRCERIMSSALRVPLALLEGRELSHSTAMRLGRSLRRTYELSRPLLRGVPGASIASAVLRTDAVACTLVPGHAGFLFVLLKAGAEWHQMPSRKVDPKDVVGFATTPLQAKMRVL